MGKLRIDLQLGVVKPSRLSAQIVSRCDRCGERGVVGEISLPLTNAVRRHSGPIKAYHGIGVASEYYLAISFAAHSAGVIKFLGVLSVPARESYNYFLFLC